MYWTNSLSILGNVCGAVFALRFAHLMRCSGQTHQCQQVKVVGNLFMELKHWLLRYQARVAAMDHQHHKSTNLQVAVARNN
jgi:hypothetical protein